MLNAFCISSNPIIKRPSLVGVVYSIQPCSKIPLVCISSLRVPRLAYRLVLYYFDRSPGLGYPSASLRFNRVVGWLFSLSLNYIHIHPIHSLSCRRDSTAWCSRAVVCPPPHSFLAVAVYCVPTASCVILPTYDVSQAILIAYSSMIPPAVSAALSSEHLK